MSNLLDKYETSVSATVADARNQSQGKIASNVFDVPDTYQTQFTTRSPGDTVVTQSPGDDDTNGTFTDRARDFYTEEIDQFGGDLHPYNQRDKKTHYVEQNNNTSGVINSSSS
jgi:hypothetical protein